MSENTPELVIDTSGAKYVLDQLLGEGGQGAVFSVRGRNLAVKLSSKDRPLSLNHVRENIARIRRLPLDGLNVARPIRMLQEPHAGYVMELMTGMVPLSTLIQVPKANKSNVTAWYLSTGGLIRRLRVLAKMASLLGRLHERGLAYGDASPQNIFVSNDISESEVWLIDCDNISQGVSQRPVYTRGYAAPELFQGHAGADSLTDAWSLGIIAYETLSLLHPFDGDSVHDGDPEIEERAFRGEVPWVDQISDTRNKAESRGLSRDVVLTRPLLKLASDCFEHSRLDRGQRPSAPAWAEKLFQAADQALICNECGGSYYFNRAQCPWCGSARPTFVLANVYLRDSDLTDEKQNPFKVVCKEPGRPTVIDRLVIQMGRKSVLAGRHLFGGQDDHSKVTATFERGHVTLEGSPDCDFSLAHRRDTNSLELSGRTERIDLSHGKSWWWMVPTKSKGVHRAVSFEMHKADGV